MLNLISTRTKQFLRQSSPRCRFIMICLDCCRRDAKRRASEVEASFSKQLRAAQDRERMASVTVERRLREEGELAQRLSSRNTDLQVRSVSVSLSVQKGFCYKLK